MLGNFLAGTCYNKTRECGNIESIFSIATGTYNVNGIIGSKVSRQAKFEQCISESLQFRNSNTSHKEHRHKRGHLVFIEFSLADIHKHVACCSAVQSFMFE